MRFLGTEISLINIEATNICALKCPSCSRQKIDEYQIDHDLRIKENLEPEFIQRALATPEKFKDVEFRFSGNLGDCIYHPHFPKLLKKMKSCGLKVHVETNGSHKKREFWNEIAEILTSEDKITFSLDGLEDTNAIYRVNSNFNDAIEAIKILKGKTHIIWKFIVFSHNEHQVEAAKEYARSIGVNEFKVNKSGRFKANDPLTPSDPKWIGTKTKNKQIIRRLLRKRNIFKMLPNVFSSRGKTKRVSDIKILPRCTSGESLFISSDGFLYPCCASRDHGLNSWFKENKEHWNLNKRSVGEILKSKIWEELSNRISDPKKAPIECVRYCGVSKEYQDQFNNDPMHISRQGVDIISEKLND